ncbi:aspartyl-phosphate phosphatase Spo0E family protein [Paenibacillus sp. MBLB4367]|uniref:aspartyl-phosphate phosphatase Spo0E family protein n=1 Tax=Paenibacillus sp. MBLB4367 TaxID=3384767 RepID=UPI0039084496
MALVQHYVTGSKYVPLIRENDPQPPSLYSNAAKRTHEALLEEELDYLRRQLEKMIRQENSLTSDAVVEMSRMLDRKINEYNQYITNMRTKKAE